MAKRVTRTTTPANLHKPGRQPFVDAYNAMVQADARRWADVEEDYLHAMRAFDHLVVHGVADQGDIQNGKGDFLNDVLALLLENCSGRLLHKRGSIPGLSFRNHSFDIAYPATGAVQFAVETKATGVPKHARNTRQSHAGGRAGSADLEKRIKEASLKNIDIKAWAAMTIGEGGGPTSDLVSWLRTSPPRCFMFISARVRDDADLAKCRAFADIATTWFDACGLYCYGAPDPGVTDRYEARPVGSTTVELGRVLARVCDALRGIS